MPTATRAMALNMGMFASNDQAKETLESMGLGKQASTLGGAFIAGFFASACRYVCVCLGERVDMKLFLFTALSKTMAYAFPVLNVICKNS